MDMTNVNNIPNTILETLKVLVDAINELKQNYIKAKKSMRMLEKRQK